MRLYHFTNREFGLQAIAKRRLKIARIDELNDPFEFLGWNLKDKVVRERLIEWKRQRNKEYGIVCFSAKWSNPLLWGHYADKHKGMALGFEVPDGDPYNQVRYRRTRLPAPVGRPLVGGDVDDLLLTKFSAWRYEQEYRLFSRLAESTEEGGLYFEAFSPTLELAEVIVGDKCAATRQEVADALGSELQHVRRYRARPAFGSFHVVRNRDGTLWK